MSRERRARHRVGSYIEQQYADDRNLAARQSIYAFQQPGRRHLGRLARPRASCAATRRCSTSAAATASTSARCAAAVIAGLVCGADLSDGHAAQRARRWPAPVRCSSATRRRCRSADDAFDVTLAMHMLYHVPDRAQGIAELRRVLRPGGVALVVTNSEMHFRELDELLDRVREGRGGGVPRAIARFAHASSPRARSRSWLRCSTDVTEHVFAAELVVDAVEPVVAYARSMGAFVVDERGELDAVITELERRVAGIIATDGAFRITTACSCFVCR